MNEQSRPGPTDPIAPIDSGADPLRPTAPERAPSSPEPAVAFSGRTPRKSEAVRAGMIVGTGLVVALGAAVAMGASPTPAAPSGGQTQTVPSDGSAGGLGGPGGGFGQFGPGGPWGQGGPAGQGHGWGAGGPGRMDGRGFGQVSVTAVSGSNLSLATDNGWKRTITVTSATTITKGGVAAKLTDVAVGDAVRFSETRNADGTYTIGAIEIVLPEAAGTVTAVGTDTITITLRDGTSQTIRTSGTTTYHLEQADGKRADVTVGSMILATGEKAADGSLTASSVSVRLPHVIGSATATTADTITLTERDGTKVTVHVGSTTTIQVAGVAGAKLSDVKTGMIVVAEGTQRSDGSIDATEIGAGASGPGRGRDWMPGTNPGASPAPNATGGTTG